jgi:hypothetical protein
MYQDYGLNIVTYEGFAWLIITGSGLDDSIYWHFFTVTINCNSSNEWVSKTRSIPYWTTSVFPPTVTDLVLIYESVTPSASVVLWLALHSWTPNFWMNQFTNEVSSITLAEPQTVRASDLLCSLQRKRMLASRYLANGLPLLLLFRLLGSVYRTVA